MTTPSLHDIANMPFSQTAAAVRRFYDHDWAKENPSLQAYHVRFNWSLKGEFDDIIMASSMERALEIAEDLTRHGVDREAVLSISCPKVTPA